MPTPGLMFVGSRILDPSTTSAEQYHRFYDSEHLPGVLASGLQGSQTVALRYENRDASAAHPFVALYPLEDAGVLQSPAVGKLVADTRTSRTFDGRDIYDLVHFDLLAYEKFFTFEAPGHEADSGDKRGRTLICFKIEPRDGGEAELDEWYKQSFEMLGKCKDYRRGTRYRRVDGGTPRFLTLNEWACEPEELPKEELAKIGGTELSKKVKEGAKKVERDVFVLIQAQGKTELKL